MLLQHPQASHSRHQNLQFRTGPPTQPTPDIHFIMIFPVPPDGKTRLIICPPCRRRPQAPTHVLQRRHTRAIINRPKPRLQIAMSILQPLPVYKDHHGSCRELIPTDSAMVEADRPYAKEPNASYMARQTCDYDAMEELHY